MTSWFVYKVISDLESIDDLCIKPIHSHRIGIIHSDLSIRVCSSEVYTEVFYLAIVNKVLHHCHSWLARQYAYLMITFANTDGTLIGFLITFVIIADTLMGFTNTV